MSLEATSIRLMKRALAFAVLLAILAPVAGVIAMACSAMPCCAEHQDRVSRPMDCCQPTMCSNETPGQQQKAAEKPTAPAAEQIALEHSALDETPDTTPQPFATATAPPRATAVRLALIATLLI